MGVRDGSGLLTFPGRMGVLSVEMGRSTIEGILQREEEAVRFVLAQMFQRLQGAVSGGPFYAEAQSSRDGFMSETATM